MRSFDLERVGATGLAYKGVLLGTTTESRFYPWLRAWAARPGGSVGPAVLLFSTPLRLRASRRRINAP